MKKKVVLLFVTLLIGGMMITGCGNKDNNNANVENNNVEDNSGEDNNTEDNSSESNNVQNSIVKNPEMLTVENDKFSFDELVMMVGEKESAMLKFLGVNETADTYEALLYGQKVALTFECKENIVGKITVTFTTSDMESISNATAEQLGQDGKIVNEVISWTFEEINIALSQNEEKCVIEIFK